MDKETINSITIMTVLFALLVLFMVVLGKRTDKQVQNNSDMVAVCDDMEPDNCYLVDPLEYSRVVKE